MGGQSSMWYVYLVRCADDTFYCGITTDVRRRLDEHNGLKPGGARYTRSRRPVHLELCVEQPDRAGASSLERKVQKLPRSRKMAFLVAVASRNAEGKGGRTEACAQIPPDHPGQ